ncbi:MAG: hypothetical protein OEY96_06970 [Gammaproteobacteria bacterium]|nr:hypothetical protein [Gammaproteobacteria bacterium]
MLTYQGKCIGVRTNPRTNQKTGEQYDEKYLGITTPKQNGYEGEVFTFEVRLSKKQLEAGLEQFYTEQKGKEIRVPVFANHRAWKDRVFTDWFLSNDGKPIK